MRTGLFFVWTIRSSDRTQSLRLGCQSCCNALTSSHQEFTVLLCQFMSGQFFRVFFVLQGRLRCILSSDQHAIDQSMQSFDQGTKSDVSVLIRRNQWQQCKRFRFEFVLPRLLQKQVEQTQL